MEKIQEIKEYRDNSQYLSQSQLLTLARSPRSMIVKQNREADFFTLGSLVDTLATLGDEVYNSMYSTAYIDPPTGQVLSYMKGLIEYHNTQMFNPSEEDAHAYAHKKCGTKHSFSVMRDKFEREGRDYYDLIMKNPNRVIISLDNDYRAHLIVDTLRTDKFTKYYFNNPEYLYQVALYGEIMKHPVKGLLDIVEVDHKHKTVRVVDLKTTSKNVYSFYNSYLSYRYDIQAAIYTKLLSYNNPYPGYKVLPPRFIVIEVDLFNPPIVFEMSVEELDRARNGRILPNGTKLKGYYKLLSEYKKHQEQGQWDYPTEYYNTGVISLDNYVGSMEV